MGEQIEQEDPCAGFGPMQRSALIWFFAVIVIGALLTFNGAKLDRWMYDNNGETLNYSNYRENRGALLGIESETLDPRQRGDLFSTTEHLTTSAAE